MLHDCLAGKRHATYIDKGLQVKTMPLLDMCITIHQILYVWAEVASVSPFGANSWEMYPNLKSPANYKRWYYGFEVPT